MDQGDAYKAIEPTSLELVQQVCELLFYWETFKEFK